MSKQRKKDNKTSNKREQSKISKLISKCNALSRRVGSRRVSVSNEIKSEYAIHLLFNQFTPFELKSSFKTIASNLIFRKFIYLSKLRRPEETFTPFLRGLSHEQDLAWCSLLLCEHKTLIEQAMGIEKEIQKNILQQNYDSALEKISMLEIKVGKSIWIESLRSGIDILRDTVRENFLDGNIANDVFNHTLYRACGYYQDEDIFLTTVKTDKRILHRDKTSIIGKIVSFYSLPDSDFEIADYQAIFKFLKFSSIYDIYKMTIKYVRQMSISHPNSENLLLLIKNIIPSIDHPIVINSATSLNLVDFKNHEMDFDRIKILDLFNNAKYDSQIALTNLKYEFELSFDLFEMAVKADIRVNNIIFGGHLSAISVYMKDLILKTSKYSESYQKLSFICYTFRSLDWFSQLQNFIERYAEFASKKDFNFLSKISSLYIQSHCVSKISIFGGEYAEYLKAQYSSSTLDIIYKVGINKNINKVNINSAPLQLVMYKLEELVEHGRQREVLENLYLIVDQNKDALVSIDAKKLLIKCLFLLNKNSEALSIFVSDSLKGSSHASIYDIDEILSESIKDFKRSASIDYPIILSLYSRLKSSKFDSELKYSFENFLFKNNYKSPLELFGKDEKYGRDRLHYFLRWVCTQENMSLFLGFTSPDEIEECRIKICEHLIRKKDTSDYVAKELLEINKRKAEKIATQNLNKSRIYVDTSTYHGRDSEQYRVLFDRYAQYHKTASLEADDEVLSNVISTLKDKDDIKNYDLISVLSTIHLPDLRLSKKNATFLSLAKLFREEFTYGNKGLNNHLSTRIRHGVLPTHLRKPFLEEYLYIASDKMDGDIYPRISSSHDEGIIKSKEALKVLLKEFSENIESHIKKINDHWLQIYTLDSVVSSINNLEEKNVGRLNFSISPLETYYVQQNLPLSPTYDDLVKVMVGWLWGKTSHNLIIIKALLKNETEFFLLGLLDNLKLEVNKNILNQKLRSDVGNAISRAKGKVSTQIDIILSWFSVGDHMNQVDSIGLVTLVEIAGKSLSLDVEIISEKECGVSSRAINYFVDVFHILFENALSKSKLDRKQLQIQTKIDCEGEEIRISVKNNCGRNSIRSSDLDFYRDSYGDEDLIRDSLQKEGGTGLFKIWKIIEKDIGIKHNMQLNYDNGDFCITFILPPNKEVSIYEDSNSRRSTGKGS